MSDSERSRRSSVRETFYGLFALCSLLVCVGGEASWEEWWTYDGISGPDFWGLLNPEWHLCSRGRRQSPVDLDPTLLLYDPYLRKLQIDKQRVNGVIWNTGHSVVFRAETGPYVPVANISGGPMSYNYQFEQIHLHYGRLDSFGSEHTLMGRAFPAEVQIYGYNSDLYSNMSEAFHRSQGIVGIALLIQIGETSNLELRLLTSQLHQIIYKGQQAELKSLSIKELLPDTEYYMTYEGSTTMPGCYETVTWIIMNKPLYITRQQFYALRKLMQGDPENSKAPLGNNYRPTQPFHHRVVRTNIDFSRKLGHQCPTMRNNIFYQVNKRN
ncbi:carbonic anhydrase-related protein 10-like isoform X2 [Centruroides vittatus]|uniref:carbonic anhydrase-related protein 10-like isoform X2 n=1 Tax=Centruroides vittatus TaxID=120091 RepID=UPI00350F5E71